MLKFSEKAVAKNNYGTSNVNNVIVIVFMIAGIQETLSLVYSHANKSGVICGIPITIIYIIRKTSASTENAAARITRRFSTIIIITLMIFFRTYIFIICQIKKTSALCRININRQDRSPACLVLFTSSQTQWFRPAGRPNHNIVQSRYHRHRRYIQKRWTTSYRHLPELYRPCHRQGSQILPSWC